MRFDLVSSRNRLILPSAAVPRRDPALAAEPAGAAAFAPLVIEMLASADGPPVQRLPLPATLRIGRTADNDLVLADDLGISRYHAELRKSPAGGYEIVDLASHNGTFVNGQRISRTMLTEHDIVRIGHATFRLAAR